MEVSNTQTAFLKSYDFMKLGQAVNREQWQSAAMILRRLSMQAKDTGMQEFEQNFTQIRQCVNRKDVMGTKQILSVIIRKRVKYLNALSSDTKIE